MDERRSLLVRLGRQLWTAMSGMGERSEPLPPAAISWYLLFVVILLLAIPPSLKASRMSRPKFACRCVCEVIAGAIESYNCDHGCSFRPLDSSTGDLSLDALLKRGPSDQAAEELGYGRLPTGDGSSEAGLHQRLRSRLPGTRIS